MSKYNLYKHSTNFWDIENSNPLYKNLELDEIFPPRYGLLQDESLYEQNRESPKGAGQRFRSSINTYYPEYTDNLFYDRISGKTIQIPKAFKRKFGKIIPDRAEMSLAYNLSLYIEGLISNKPNMMPINQRLAILQAGIGSGKTTLLWHFFKFTLIRMIAKGWPNLQCITVTIDLNIFSSAEKLRQSTINEELRRLINIENPELDCDEGWKQILRYLARKFRRFEAIEKSRSAERKFMESCMLSDDYYIKHLLSYLGAIGYLFIITLDNIDRHPVDNQIAGIEYLRHLLIKAESGFGIIALREYTLNHWGYLKRFTAFHDVKPLHITHPSFLGMLERRFNYAGRLLDTKGGPSPIKLSPYITLSMTSYKDFLTKWAQCFRNQNVIEWLRGLCNADLSEMLRIVRAVMGSSKLRWERVISEYYTIKKLYDYKKYGPPWLQEIPEDEFLRLVYLGRRDGKTVKCYREDDDSFVINPFNDGRRPSTTKHISGRYPILIRYRIMLYFYQRDITKKQEFFRDFSIYGYSRSELEEKLQWLINEYLVESKEGMFVRRVKSVGPTRRLDCHMDLLIRLLVSIENLRNDTYINYESNCHMYETTMIDDVLEVLKFIEYIYQQEMEEYEYMKNTTRKPARYKMLLFDEAICWRTLRACGKRLRKLEQLLRSRYNRDEVDRMATEFNKIREKIIRSSVKGEILPEMSSSMKRLCPILKVVKD